MGVNSAANGQYTIGDLRTIKPSHFPDRELPQTGSLLWKKFQGLKGLNSRGALLLSRILHVLLDEILQDIEEGKTSSRKEMPQSHP